MPNLNLRVIFFRYILTMLIGVIIILAVGAWLYISGRLPATDSTATTRPLTAEELAAGNDHDTISNWVAGCVGVPSAHDLPDVYQNIFNMPTYVLWADKIRQQPNRDTFNQQENEVIALSKNLYTQRINLANTVARYSSSANMFQWIIVIIGFTTTAVVSISTTDIWKIDTKIGKSIRIFAVVLPALGTAVAAASAFYPRDQLGRETALLANLAQLHDRIAIEVWHLQCIARWPTDEKSFSDPKNPVTLNKVTIENWETREREILNPPQTTPTTSPSNEALAKTSPASNTPSAKPNPDGH